MSQNIKIEVRFVDGSVLTCANRDDAELVLDLERRIHEGNTGRTLPRQTLAALARAGLNHNAFLYRAALHYAVD